MNLCHFSTWHLITRKTLRHPTVHVLQFLSLDRLNPGTLLFITFSSYPLSRNGWRWIAPHAFGHDGYRWHVRAWCEENRDYRDFAVSRIKDAEWPTELAGDVSPDEDWEEWVTLTFVPNKTLSLDQQEAVKADYGMKGGKLVVQVRKAMLDYTLAHLRLPLTGGRMASPHLVVDG